MHKNRLYKISFALSDDSQGWGFIILDVDTCWTIKKDQVRDPDQANLWPANMVVLQN